MLIRQDNRNVTYFYNMTLIIYKQRQDIIRVQCRGFRRFATCCMIGRSFLICTILHTDISQFIVVSLTLVEVMILFNGDFRGIPDQVVIGAVIRDVQSAITIYEGQVSVTIESTRMGCSYRDEVTVIDIVDRGRGITEHRGCVGIGSR